jgi:hypothetical protein
VRPYRAFSGLHKIMPCNPVTLCRDLRMLASTKSLRGLLNCYVVVRGQEGKQVRLRLASEMRLTAMEQTQKRKKH